MLQALERHFPAQAAWTRPVGGLFVWVTLPRDFDGRELLPAARRCGVHYSNGELFHSDGGGSQALRLTYASTTPSQIESGVETLGRLIRERWPSPTEAGERKPSETMPIF
jgi:DNA-binding transcriptional MocR family regulator